MSRPAEPACQPPTRGEAPATLPWDEDPRAGAKTEIAGYVAERAEGVPLAKLARDVLDAEPATGGADYRLAARVLHAHPALFRTDRRDGRRWVEPRTPLFYLTAANKHRAGSQEGGGMAMSAGDAPRRHAERVASGRRMVASDDVRGSLLGALATKRATTEDRLNVFQRADGAESYLVVPWRDQWNDGGRVRGKLDRLDGAFRRAAARYGGGLMLTVTTDPTRYASIADAEDGLREDVDNLARWLGDNFVADGGRPERVTAVEFTESGIPHAHIAVFGIEHVPHARLSNYWSDRRGRGQVVWASPIASEGGRSWRWEGEPPRDARGRGRRGPRDYLRKALEAQQRLAKSPPETVREAADALRDEATGTAAYDRGREWWRLGLAFGLETRRITVSPSLKGPSAPKRDGPARWVYVGTASVWDLPGHVLRNRHPSSVVSRGRDRPPPEPSRSRGTPPETAAPPDSGAAGGGGSAKTAESQP